MRRSGITLAEGLVGVTIALIVIVLVMAVGAAGRRMGRAAASAVSLQNVALLQEMLDQDLIQLGLDPAVPAAGLLSISPTRLSLRRCVFAGELVKLRAVRYEPVRTPRENWQLARFEQTPGGPSRRLSPAVLTAILFKEVPDPARGTPDLQVTLSVIDEDRHRFGGDDSRVSTHVLLLRVPVLRMAFPALLGPSLGSLVPEDR